MCSLVCTHAWFPPRYSGTIWLIAVPIICRLVFSSYLSGAAAIITSSVEIAGNLARAGVEEAVGLWRQHEPLGDAKRPKNAAAAKTTAAPELPPPFASNARKMAGFNFV